MAACCTTNLKVGGQVVRLPVSRDVVISKGRTGPGHMASKVFINRKQVLKLANKQAKLITRVSFFVLKWMMFYDLKLRLLARQLRNWD